MFGTEITKEAASADQINVLAAPWLAFHVSWHGNEINKRGFNVDEFFGPKGPVRRIIGLSQWTQRFHITMTDCAAMWCLSEEWGKHMKRARIMFWEAGLSVSVINNHFLQMKNMGWSHDKFHFKA